MVTWKTRGERERERERGRASEREIGRRSDFTASSSSLLSLPFPASPMPPRRHYMLIDDCRLRARIAGWAMHAAHGHRLLVKGPLKIFTFSPRPRQTTIRAIWNRQDKQTYAIRRTDRIGQKIPPSASSKNVASLLKIPTFPTRPLVHK